MSNKVVSKFLAIGRVLNTSACTVHMNFKSYTFGDFCIFLLEIFDILSTYLAAKFAVYGKKY